MKGKLIVIDGVDGSGKATQSKMLVERLCKEGIAVEYIDFPQYGKKSAGLVEEYLNGAFGTAEEVGPYRASVFYACDRYAAAPMIRKWLSEGKIVVANRFTSSNMGHQAGKIKDVAERDKFLKWLEELEYGMFGIPKPDVQVLLYVPPEVGQQLVDRKASREYIGGKKRDMHEADLGHLKAASEAYLYVAKKDNWLVVECAANSSMKSPEEIHRMVWEKVKKLL